MFKKRLRCCTVLRPDHNLKIKALCHLAGADKAGTRRPTDYRVFSSLAAPCTGHELTITSCGVDDRPGGNVNGSTSRWSWQGNLQSLLQTTQRL